MKEIVETLVIAILLVILVVYIFLQGWRATLIPLLAVPVSLIGTFMFFPVFGFSINTLSLFGLVLAIGLVVDDAIVVVEAVERHIEEGMTPKEAALKAMEELSGPVVGIALVLSAVFVPTAFIPGITGRLYQQFAVTIAISVLLSAFNALTLSPALAALVAAAQERPAADCCEDSSTGSIAFSNAPRTATCACAARLIRKSVVAMIAACGVRGGGGIFRQPRAGELPARRRPGLCVRQHAVAECGVAATHAKWRRTRSRRYLANTPGVKYSTSVVGFSLLSFVRTSYNAFFLRDIQAVGRAKDRGRNNFRRSRRT